MPYFPFLLFARLVFVSFEVEGVLIYIMHIYNTTSSLVCRKKITIAKYWTHFHIFSWKYPSVVLYWPQSWILIKRVNFLFVVAVVEVAYVNRQLTLIKFNLPLYKSFRLKSENPHCVTVCLLITRQLQSEMRRIASFYENILSISIYTSKRPISRLSACGSRWLAVNTSKCMRNIGRNASRNFNRFK